MLTKWGKKIVNGMLGDSGVNQLSAAYGFPATITAKVINGDTIYINPGVTAANNTVITFEPTVTGRYATSGFVLGSDGTAPTENDYMLGNQIINTISASLQNTIESKYDSDRGVYIARRLITVTNNAADDLIIREVGRLVQVCCNTTGLGDEVTYSQNLLRSVMLDRTVLDEPVTLHGGDSGVVVYEFLYDISDD